MADWGLLGDHSRQSFECISLWCRRLLLGEGGLLDGFEASPREHRLDS
jgi:hypothetical protein